MPVSVFITGATGYIGGQALYELLNNKDGVEYIVTALVRTKAKAENLEKSANKPSNTNNSRVTAVIGSLDDLDLFKQEVENNDVIINTANVDHVPSAEVLSKALEASTTKKILIHTSGTSVIGDPISANKSATTKVYSDEKSIDEINSLDPSQPHRPVDALVLDIHKKSKNVTTAIICPSNIVGISDGYDNVLSIQVPFLTRLAKKNNQSFSVYTGDYIWSHVHIKDLGELYYLILKKFLAGEDIPANEKGYYFGAYALENEGAPTTKPSEIEHTWRDVSAAVGKSLYQRKLIDTPEVAELPVDVLVKLGNDDFTAHYWGSNSRSRADNGYKIGWKPKYSSLKQYWEEIENDIEYLVSHGKL